MVILHVVAPGSAGGLEGVVEALASGHQARGHDVHVAAVVDPGGEYPTLGIMRGAGVQVHTVVVSSRNYRAERSGIAELCRRISPDIVHTHGYRPDVLDAPVARRMGLPTITTVHGFTGGGWKNRLYELLQRFAFRRFHAVAVVARPQIDELVRSSVPRERIRLVRNGWRQRVPAMSRVDARRLFGIRDDQFHIGWVGRLSAEKDPVTFVRALREGAGPGTVATLIGDGPERARVQAVAAELGLGPALRLLGTLPEAVRLFPAFDLFVLSSRTEGTPLVLFEAMAAGVPIVATAVGGVPDVVGGGQALLVPPGDHEAVAEAIRLVRDDPAATADRVRRAQARLADFAVAPWLASYEALYESVRGTVQ